MTLKHITSQLTFASKLAGPQNRFVSISYADQLLPGTFEHDEALKGEWKGFRSSRLNIQYRVIYKVEKDKILIAVVNVIAHDYRRN